ncbi:MAG: hypothetical protein E7340_02950 [Clostridiales bacterium]|nr:hypothetical protein [Clostridiales bacterium]
MISNKLAIDFDSVYTNIFVLGSGLVLSEPTVAAISQDGKKEVKAVGYEAKKLIGKTAKNTKIVFPIFEGEVVNESVAEGLLSTFLKKVELKSGLFGSHALFSVPCGVTGDIIFKLKNVAQNSGISNVYFVEAPLLAALGQRIKITESSPCFVIDLGGGVTNVAAVSLDGVIAGVSVNFGYNKVSTDIIDYIAENYGLQIGLTTAERLKNDIGSLDMYDALSTVVSGRDVITGAPKSITIKANDIFNAVKKYYEKIAEIATTVLGKLPPEVSAEIRKAGFYVSGVGSLIHGLKNFYKDIFEIDINIHENASSVVALGGGVVLGDNKLLKKLSIPV